MKDLRSARAMWLKAALFLVIGLTAAVLVWIQAPTWKVTVLLVLAVWAFCRAYYFAFYVLEKYADPRFRYSGLLSLVRYVLRRRA
jgi:hypothetical protein